MLNRLGVLGGALLLSACSLINSYDEVLPGDGGGSPTSSSTTTTTSSGGGSGGDGGGATTSTSSGGGGGVGGQGGEGGGGGGGLPPLNCSFTAKSLLQDTVNTVTIPHRIYDQAYPFMASDGRTRMLVSRRNDTGVGRTLQLIEVSPTGAASIGSFASPIAVLDVRRIESSLGGGIGALVQMPIGTNSVLQLMVWEDSATIATFPTQYDLMTFTTAPPLRAVFQHVGPAARQIDYVVAMPGGGSTFEATYRRVGASGNTVASIPVATSTTNSNLIAPKGLIVYGDTIHAFLGDTVVGASSRQYVFQATDAAAGSGLPVGPNGSSVGLAEGFSGSAILGGGIANSSTVSLRVGNRGNSVLGADNVLSGLPEVESFTLAQGLFPSGGRTTAAPSTFFMPGTLATRTQLSLRIFFVRNDDQTGLRFRDDDLLAFSSNSASFGDVAVATSPFALADSGGQGAIFFSEVASTTGERLFQVRFNCTN